VWTLDAQYMLGSELLVAPVFSKDGRGQLLRPAGRGPRRRRNGGAISTVPRTYEEGRWYTETHGFDTLPILGQARRRPAREPDLEGGRMAMS